MHLPFIAHTCAHQMYMIITCMRLKRALHIIVSVQDMDWPDTVEVLQRMNYLIQEGL